MKGTKESRVLKRKKKNLVPAQMNLMNDTICFEENSVASVICRGNVAHRQGHIELNLCTDQSAHKGNQYSGTELLR